MTVLAIVPNPEAEKPDLRSVSALLRTIADNIDAGDYGIKEFGEGCLVRGGLVLRVSSQEPHIFGLGDTQASQVYMDFHAGAEQLMHMQSPGR